MKNINLIYSRHNINSKPPEVYPSAIPFNDMTIVIKGTLEYNIDGKNIVVNGGDMIFMPPGTKRVRKESFDNVDYISFNFNCDSDIDLPVFLSGALHGDVLLLIGAYDNINNLSYLDNTEKNEYILGCIISLFEDRVKRQKFNPLTLKIMEYIHKNIGNKITLEDIGRHTFFSPIYCDTLFKRETGRSIIDYLLEKRIDEAKRLLIEGTLSLQSVSENVGFSDYNYFSRVFKARSGYSPSSYRKSILDHLAKNDKKL